MGKHISMKGNSTFVFNFNRVLWDRVIPLLEQLGHTVYSLNMPGHEVDTSDISLETPESSARKVADIIATIPGKVILVGNSRGGIWNTLLGEMIPEKIEKIVYNNSWLLGVGESGNGIDGSGWDPKPWHINSKDGGKTVYMTDDPKPMLEYRPISKGDLNHMWRGYEGQYEIVDLLYKRMEWTEERWGSIRRFAVIGTEEIDIPVEMHYKMVENLPCEKIYEIEGGDHGSGYSTPEELAFILHDIARL